MKYRTPNKNHINRTGKRNRASLSICVCFIILLSVMLSACGIKKEGSEDSTAGQTELQGEDTAGLHVASEAKEDDTVIRVAYVVSDNFQAGSEGEHKYGYGYEYLQKIAYYTGWKYEYVYGGFQESLNRLMNGEVDLMGDVSYMEEWDGSILYSDLPQGEEYFYVYTSADNTSLNPDELSSFRGIRVGVNKGAYSQKVALAWSEENALDCEFVEYTSMEQCLGDLQSGLLDAAVGSEVYINIGWKPLMQIGKSPYYFAVNGEKQELQSELNLAMEKITRDDPYYNEELRAKYMTTTNSTMVTLTTEEKDWLTQHPVIKVGYLTDYMPYCGVDADTGEVGGMMISLLENICKVYPMSYETEGFASYEDMAAALEAGEVDAIFPVYGDYGVAEENGVMITDATTHSSMTVFNSGTELKDQVKVAVSVADPFQIGYVDVNYSYAEPVYCDSLEACRDAVAAGKAEFTVAETARANELEDGKQKGVQRAELQQLVNVSFAVQRKETDLLSILNKGILVTDDSLVTNSLIVNSQQDQSYTTMDYLREHVLSVILFLVVIFAIIIALVIAFFVSRIRSQRKIVEAEKKAGDAKHKAEHDALTGLLNRAAFQKLCHKLKDSDRPLALLVIDVDKFKSVNDTYGHETGDHALVRVADVLSQYFRSGDYVIRYAGDEFVVLMDNVAVDKKDVLALKIQKINETLKTPQDDVPKLSLSVGIAFSDQGYQDDLFNKADQALYYTKQNGRCGYKIYEQ